MVDRVKNVRSVLDNVAVEQVAEITVSGETDAFDLPALFVSEETYVAADQENDWLPIWMFLVMHGVSQNEIRYNPAIQAIIQKFRDFYPA